MPSDRVLRVVMYQYVRDPSRNEFTSLDGMPVDDFRNQVKELASNFEMASIESSLDFLSGEYRPRRDLCLLTFDDGLKEHFTEVLPILAEKRIRGVFFVITSCLDERRLAPLHMSQFLMASLGFEEYAGAFFRTVVGMRPDAFAPLNVDTIVAARIYPWDPPEVARFKYLLEFGLDPDLRDRAVTELFTSHVAKPAAFADSLYMNWDEVKQMQKSGMSIGGHTHQHKPLAKLASPDLAADLETCKRLLAQKLTPQAVWPFSYPDGTLNSFHIRAVRKLQQLGFRCAFSTESGDSRRGSDLYTICRTDCKKALAAQVGA